MKQIKRILVLVFLIMICDPVLIKAEEVVVVAGEAAVTRENYQLMAYKELNRISGLLITDPVQYMEEYKRILEVYGPYFKETTMYDLYSAEDIEYLERCVETETFGGEDFISKVNIANVIINRMMDDERFPSTIADVVKAPGQFAYSKTKISPLTVAACEFAAVNGDTTNGALWFHSGSKTETFNGGKYLFTDALGHHYYR